MPASHPRVGILGGTGWLGLALGRNLLKRGLPQASLAILNRRGRTDDYGQWPDVRWAHDRTDLEADCDVLVLSVRPDDYEPATGPAFSGLVLSFMAGVPMDDLIRDYPAGRIARAMPGGGATEGRAHVPYIAAQGCDDADIAQAEAILSAIGQVDRVQGESQLAFMSALSGSGAAYPALLAQAMYDHALQQGIDPAVAWRGVVSVVCDASAALRDGPESAGELLDAYRGYRGVTDAGLDAAQANGFAGSIGNALDAATAKALTMRPNRPPKD